MFKRHTFIAPNNNLGMSSCLFMRKDNQGKVGWRTKNDGKRQHGEAEERMSFKPKLLFLVH